MAALRLLLLLALLLTAPPWASPGNAATEPVSREMIFDSEHGISAASGMISGDAGGSHGHGDFFQVVGPPPLAPGGQAAPHVPESAPLLLDIRSRRKEPPRKPRG